VVKTRNKFTILVAQVVKTLFVMIKKMKKTKLKCVKTEKMISFFPFFFSFDAKTFELRWMMTQEAKG
jgi:hypothetical protein